MAPFVGGSLGASSARIAAARPGRMGLPITSKAGKFPPLGSGGLGKSPGLNHEVPSLMLSSVPVPPRGLPNQNSWVAGVAPSATSQYWAPAKRLTPPVETSEVMAKGNEDGTSAKSI